MSRSGPLRWAAVSVLGMTAACGGLTSRGDDAPAGPNGGSAGTGGAQSDAGIPEAADCVTNPVPTSSSWASRFGDEVDQNAEGVALDACGNTTIVGSFFGTVDFGGGPLANQDYVVLFPDLFLASFDALGKPRWSRRLGEGDWNWWRRLAATAEGHVVVVGGFTGAADFGGGPVTVNDIGPDVFIAKYDANGQHLWSHTYGSKYDSDSASSVAVTSDGGTVVTGRFGGSITFGPKTLTGLSGGLFPRDGFVVRLDDAGEVSWSRAITASDGEGVLLGTVAAASHGGLVVLGSFNGDMTLDGSELHAEGYEFDGFILALDGAGSVTWVHQFATGEVFPSDCAVGADGSVTVVGTAKGEVDLGGGILDAGQGALFVSKRKPNGEYLLGELLAGGSLHAVSASLDGPGHLVVAGRYEGDVTFGDVSLPAPDVPTGFVASFDANGKALWARMLAGSTGVQLSAHQSGLALTGGFQGELNVAGATFTSSGYVPGTANGGDVFVARTTPSDSGPW